MNDGLSGETHTAGASPAVFSVMEKPVSDAWETASVPEKRDQETAAIQSRVSTAVKIVFAFEKIVFVVEKIVFVPVKIVSKLENAFTATERMVS